MSDKKINKILSKELNSELIEKISRDKKEPQWMLDIRLQAFDSYKSQQMPSFGPDLSALDLGKIVYYVHTSEVKNARSWSDVPADIKNTFERLGIPAAEREALAGVGAQYESEMVYHSLKEAWREKGVIYEDLSVAVEKYPELLKKNFSKCLSPSLHIFMALHYAVWSGGTFLYIPPGVHLDVPVQSYFRMNTPGAGQFEHTLIVVGQGASAHYIEGCSAPRYDVSALHAGGVEVFVAEGGYCRYSSVENWSRDVYNLNTKRAVVEKEGIIEWVTGNLGSHTSMVYPCSVLKGEGSKSEHLGVSFAAKNQIQDVGAKVIHIGKNTTSNIMAKGIAKDGGQSHYRGLVKILPQAKNAVSNVRCEALIMDKVSASDTFPQIDIGTGTAQVTHEATAGKISEEKLFYLMSRGLDEDSALSLIVNGFIEPIIKQIPLEYAVEMNRLIEMEIEKGKKIG